MGTWKTLSKEKVYTSGNDFAVEIRSVMLPNGTIIDNWPWIISRDFVNIIVRDEDGRFVFFKQEKYAIDGTLLAPIAGYIEDNEAPLEAAKRELLEETGFVSDNWTCLGKFQVAANLGISVAHLYLARNARYNGEISSDDPEDQVLIKLTEKEMADALDNCKFKVLSWATAVSLALRIIENNV